MPATVTIEVPRIDGIESLSARWLHEALRRTHAAGNQMRKLFIDGLRLTAESRRSLELGYPSIIAYVESLRLLEERDTRGPRPTSSSGSRGSSPGSSDSRGPTRPDTSPGRRLPP